jgi:hypothetical protein
LAAGLEPYADALFAGFRRADHSFIGAGHRPNQAKRLCHVDEEQHRSAWQILISRFLSLDERRFSDRAVHTEEQDF